MRTPDISFTVNTKADIIRWCNEHASSPIAIAIQKQLQEPNQKSITLTHQLYPHEHDTQSQKIQLYANDIIQVITLLKLCDISIEHLTLHNIPFSEMKPIFAFLKNGMAIRSFESQWVSMAFCQPTTHRSDITELLEFMETARFLEKITIGTTGLEKEGDRYRPDITRNNSSSCTFSQAAHVAFIKAKNCMQERNQARRMRFLPPEVLVTQHPLTIARSTQP